MNSINKSIACNVKDCVFNEHGCNCNLDKVTISKGSGENHYCKSFIPLEDEKEYDFPLENEERFQSHHNDIESGEEYFNFGELIDEVEEKSED